MTIEEFKTYCYTKKGVSEGFPFGEETLVMKVGTKMFACGSISKKPFKINLKCDPDMVQNLRDSFKDIEPGFHMNKTHWNTINMEGSLTTEKLYWLIDHSYELVLSKLPKKERESFSH
ncbi:MAG: MmcQ/YjbR family DNA-binding protein [Spirochaetales bacterium]|uniref:MmcQ/YjbR family DNA-binding protein n=1 Tax=Candidatus Thalassospirochaeta sargassi TaxID=3119039 RepID=A0AAJ1IDL6_9SPIO|nr:MmcQ/YjbR family DNA-binding protein [Spirochaetales bacterium]